MGLLEPTIGEALDRLSILALKINAATEAGLRTDSFVQERDDLGSYVDRKVSCSSSSLPFDSGVYSSLRASLDLTNARLWTLEDAIRQHRASPAPHDDVWRLRLADIALEISERNDFRASIVRDINALFGVAHQEKLYRQTDDMIGSPRSSIVGAT